MQPFIRREIIWLKIMRDDVQWDYSNHSLRASQMDAMAIHVTMADIVITMINMVTPVDMDLLLMNH